MRRAVLWLFAFSFSLPAADEWLRLTTPHFELFTTAGEKRGRETILHFEQVRSFFLTVTPTQKMPEFPVRIIAFQTARQYGPYAPNTATAAYYTQSQYRDYIVMRDLGDENFSTVTHEYMHLITRHSGVHLPLWLNEGWADVYSTLRSMGNKAVVGEPIPGRVQKLQQEKWISIGTLISTANDSPVYNEKDRAGIFYAEAWALTHMLYLSPEYRPNFDRMLQALAAGKNTAEAFQVAFGKDENQVFADLEVYLRRHSLYSGVIDAKLEKSAENPQVRAAEPYESGLALADLLGATRKRDDARKAFFGLEKQFPGRPETARSLGYLEWRSGDDRAAREYFEKAFAAGESDPEMCFHLAMLARAQRQEGDQVRAPLLKALQAKPDYLEARLQLGYLELSEQNYAAALLAFRQISNAPPQHASALFGGLAAANLSVGNLELARSNAEEARKWATTAPDTERAEHILRDLENRAEGERLARERSAALQAVNTMPAPRPLTAVSAILPETDAPLRQFPPPPVENHRVEGTAIAFDCAREGARLRVLVNGRTLVFAFGDPDQVMLRHNGKVVHEFTCGPQKPYKVAVEYDEAPAGSELAGYIRLLEF